ncbi:hypothetical protein GC096_08635 [Paenibacillus sp. LMG 31461]|uniref:Restriction endonuclease type IV Mrr domain-containing protein n=1 Tax=Paenibacillus plantarum TaxID=2654975 RepID=A0ABX1X7P7_9BACL|nr:restriction endonuclease [Paenibacillus plantarum]NOU64088.1 hypothetical protein [Paenibacillus plantarum]
MNIFISYSDKHDAYDLISNLRKQNEINLHRQIDMNILNDPYESNYDVETIQRNIKKSNVVLAIINNFSNNVFFEIGYAIGNGKQVIIICPYDVEIPSNLKGLIYFEGGPYNSDVAFKVLNYIYSDIIRYDKNEFKEADIDTLLNLFENNNIDFEQFDYDHFEKIVMDSFERKGFEVINKQSIRDYGYDFVVYDNSKKKLLVEVKKTSLSTKCSINTVQQLLGAIHAYGAGGGILISTSGFTGSALNFSEKCTPRIEMWTMQDIKEKLSS